MALIYWPSELPQRVLADGYSEQLRDGRLQTKTSAGPGKTRRRYSSAVLPVQASIVIDYATKARFERFWYEETDNGSLPFVMPDQTHDGVPLITDGGAQLLSSSSVPLVVTAKWLVMFDRQEAPRITPWGLIYQASFGLSVLP